MKKVLIIEDDSRIRRILQLELEYEGYRVTLAKDGDEGLKFFNSERFDIILLDLMMPKVSGEEVCRELRKKSEIPIIVLTAKDQLSNKIELLDMGADDYITKPFEIEELLARMRVALRNKGNYKEVNTLQYGNLLLNTELKKLSIDGNEVLLTKTEYNLIEFFMINKEIVLSRGKILEEVWGYDSEREEKIVDVYINSLRKKIETSTKKYIHSVRGFGYVFKDKSGEE